MDQRKGILFLAGPLEAGARAQREIENTTVMTLIFDENGRYLSLAQTALWRLRQTCGWVCVAAQGHAAIIALALAAQLPVERLALVNSRLFAPERDRLPRELVRLEKYARRNLSLVVSEILLIGTAEAEVRGMLRSGAGRRVCALEEGEEWTDLLAAPWEQASRNNLLIPRKRV